MMISKKLRLGLSLGVSALVCTNFIAVSANAFDHEIFPIRLDMFTEGEHGEAYLNTVGNNYLVITGENGLRGVEDDFYSCTSWSASKLSGNVLSDQTLQSMRAADSSLAELLDSYGDSACVYMMYVHDGYQSEEQTLFRKFLLSNENVLQVIGVKPGKTFCCWDGGAQFVVTDEVEEKMKDGTTLEALYPEIFGDDAPLVKQLKQYHDWKARCDSWNSSVNTATMTAAEIADSRKAAGLETDYEMLTYVFDLSSKAVQEYPDILVQVAPTIGSSGMITADFHTFSLWDNIGDLTGDGQVTAADASELLIASANQGAGSDSGLSDSQQQYADVNADGVFNAEDAAILLMYAAEQGSGGSMTLEEFVSQK